MFAIEAPATGPLSLGVVAQAGFADEATLEGVVRLRSRGLAIEPLVGVVWVSGEDIYASIGPTDLPELRKTYVESVAFELGGLARVRLGQRPVGDVDLLLGSVRRVGRTAAGEPGPPPDYTCGALVSTVGVGVTHPLSERVALGIDVSR